MSLAFGRGIVNYPSQAVYPGKRDYRIDLLGLKRLNNGKFIFVVLELKNK